MPIDPLQELVCAHRATIQADARKRALVRTARQRRARPGRLRTTAAHLLHAAAARIEAPGPASPRTSSGL
jgi:hypothetical protein